MTRFCAIQVDWTFRIHPNTMSLKVASWKVMSHAHAVCRALSLRPVTKHKYLCPHEAHILAGETQMINDKDNTSVNYEILKKKKRNRVRRFQGDMVYRAGCTFTGGGQVGLLGKVRFEQRCDEAVWGFTMGKSVRLLVVEQPVQRPRGWPVPA